MNEEYVYNTIVRILSQRTNNIPNSVPFNELLGEIIDDLKMVINNLVSDKRIKYSRDVNGGLLIYDAQ